MSANPMRDQIFATPKALAGGFEELETAARLVLSFEEIFRTRRIILIGSGDSYFAAKAAEMMLLRHTQIPVEVRTPLEAGRYHTAFSGTRDIENALVIALSNSGAAARVCEAAGLYRKRGALVLAVTQNKYGRLAKTADKALITPATALPSAPGYAGFLMALVALDLLALRFAEVRGSLTMDAAQALRGTFAGHFDALQATVEAADAPARELAEAITEKPCFEFLGAGPNAGSAEYGAAKILEATGRHAWARDLEEWTHLNYFDSQPGDIISLIILPGTGRATSRAVELARYWEKLRPGLAVIAPQSEAEKAGISDRPLLPITGSSEEELSPLFTTAGAALFAAHLAEKTGAAYGRGGTGAWADSASAATVQQSTIEDELS